MEIKKKQSQHCNTMRVKIWLSINLYIILILIPLFQYIFLLQIHPLVLLSVNLNRN